MITLALTSLGGSSAVLGIAGPIVFLEAILFFPGHLFLVPYCLHSPLMSSFLSLRFFLFIFPSSLSSLNALLTINISSSFQSSHRWEMAMTMHFFSWSCFIAFSIILFILKFFPNENQEPGWWHFSIFVSNPGFLVSPRPVYESAGLISQYWY